MSRWLFQLSYGPFPLIIFDPQGVSTLPGTKFGVLSSEFGAFLIAGPFKRNLSELQETLQLLRPAGVSQLSQGLRLNLSNPLPGDFKILPDLFQGMVIFFSNAETHPQNFFLSRG